MNECASYVVVLLRRIIDDPKTPPLDPSNPNAWRFTLTIVLSTFSWFKGSDLGQPNIRDYLLENYESQDGWDGDMVMTRLLGSPTSPFPGLILDKVSQEDAETYRTIHKQLRIDSRAFEDEDARTLD